LVFKAILSIFFLFINGILEQQGFRFTAGAISNVNNHIIKGV